MFDIQYAADQPIAEPAKNKRQGFTLIELLVVIAIIAVLAAILFPVFAKARENARRASCMSNLKQIGLGFMQYTQDYDENMPYFYHYTTDNSVLYRWQDDVDPYIKSLQLFICASDKAPMEYTFKRPGGATLVTSYGTNGVYYMPSGSTNPYATSDPFAPPLTRWSAAIPNPPAHIASIDEPATTILLADGKYTLEIETWEHTDLLVVASSGTRSPRVDKRHLEGANYLYCDGHVKWLKRTSASMWTKTVD